MKTITVSDFKYANVFGELTFNDVSIHIPDEIDQRKIRRAASLEGIDYSIPVSEIKRMERSLALHFFKRTYREIFHGERTLSIDELKGVQEILEVNRSDLGKLLGIHKGSVTNLFKGKAMKSTLCILIMERLGMELARPGSARHMLEGGEPEGRVPEASKVINATRYQKVRVA